MIEDVDVNKVNVYKVFVNELGKEDRETIIPSPFGGTVIREWKCGCIVARRIEYDFITLRHVMKDSYQTCSKHKYIDEKIKKLLEGDKR